MPRYKIAHIKQRDTSGLDVHLIIIPLETAFGDKAAEDQQAIIAGLQVCVTSAGLIGTIVPVWMDRSGRTKFIALHEWHPCFERASMDSIRLSINRELLCSG